MGNFRLNTPSSNIWTFLVTASLGNQDVQGLLWRGVPRTSLISYSPPLLTPSPLRFPICRWLCFPNLIDADRYIVSASPDCQRLLKSNDFLSPNNLKEFFFPSKRQKKKKKKRKEFYIKTQVQPWALIFIYLISQQSSDNTQAVTSLS